MKPQRRPSGMTRRKALIVGAYACSGAAGLIYEVCWTRLLSLYLGSSTAAAASVLTAFMTGLAVGAAVGGRFADRLTARRALQGYVLLEIGAAALSLLPVLAIAPIIITLRAVYSDGAASTAFAIWRLVTAAALLMMPAAVLGAAFPFAARSIVVGDERHPIARLYAANTFGAVVGACAAGFVILPAAGMLRTTLAGAALSLLAAGLALLGLRFIAPTESVAPKTRDLDAVDGEPTSGWSLTIPAVVVATGFAVCTYEMVWIRLFGLLVGPSTYAFSAVVTTVIAGLAIGAALSSSRRIGERRRRPALALVLMGVAVTMGVSTVVAGGALPRRLLASIVSSPEIDRTFQSVLLAQSVQIAVVMLPCAIALGAAFPLALMLDTSGAPRGIRRAGLLYGLNTAGSVMGAVGTAFVLIPRLGLEGTLWTSTVALALAAGFAMSGRSRLWVAGGTLASVVAGMWLSPAWDRELLASGAYKYAWRAGGGLHSEALLRAGDLVFYRDGAAATVTVKRLAGETALAIDGKVDASDGGDMLTQKLLAHLPLLVHPQPQSVGIIGLGSGVTLAAALTHPILSADVVEIAPEVVEASAFFAAVNRHALSDPRTRLIVGDGRSHLMLARKQYDVLISEPSNPWMAGVASLFTREFFAAMRARLAPGGVVCQWAHTYDISEDDLRSIVATFSDVFPNATFWLVGEGDLLMIGGDSAAAIAVDRIQQHWHRQGVRSDLADVGAVNPSDLLSMRLDAGRLRQFAAGAVIQTDDRLQLEFSGPAALYETTGEENGRTLLAMQDPGWAGEEGETSADLFGRGRMLMRAAAYVPAFASYLRAVARAPADTDAVVEIVPAAVASGQESVALDVLRQRTRRWPEDIPARVALSTLLAAGNQFAEALEEALGATRRRPDAFAAWEQVAAVASDVGSLPDLEIAVQAMSALRPGSSSALYYAGSRAFLQRRLVEAEQAVTAAIAADPRRAAAYNLLGATQASQGKTDQARQAFTKALALDPRDLATYLNAAELELNSGNRREAERKFNEALSLDPSSRAALDGLTSARAM